MGMCFGVRDALQVADEVEVKAVVGAVPTSPAVSRQPPPVAEAADANDVTPG